MKKMRIELTKSRQAASTQSQVLAQLGYAVGDIESCEVIWVNDPVEGALVTYADPADNEVWVVVGRK